MAALTEDLVWHKGGLGGTRLGGDVAGPSLRHVAATSPDSRDGGDVASDAGESVVESVAGELYSWGWNANSQLGQGDKNSRVSPQQVASLRAVVAVAAGSRCTVAVAKGGHVYTWGRGDDGQLGRGRELLSRTPGLVASLSGVQVRSVACRAKHVLALTTLGEVFAWGSNEFGQCGVSKDKRALFRPVFLASLKNVVVQRVACGRQHSLALAQNGALYSWGAHADGATGLGVTKGCVASPRRVAALAAINVTHVSCGSRHSLCISEQGHAYAFGWGFYGQLGCGDTRSRPSPTRIDLFVRKGLVVKHVCCGYRHSFAVTERRRVAPPRVPATKDDSSDSDEDSSSDSDDNGSGNHDVWAWGWNSHTMLGVRGTKSRVVTPARVSALQGVTVTAMAAGGRHSLCVVASQFTPLKQRLGTSNSLLGRVQGVLRVGEGLQVLATPSHPSSSTSPRNIPGRASQEISTAPFAQFSPSSSGTAGIAVADSPILGAELKGVVEADEDTENEGPPSTARWAGLGPKPPTADDDDGALVSRAQYDSESEYSSREESTRRLPKLLGPDHHAGSPTGPLGAYSDDIVLVWGKNGDGELGLADVRPRGKPTKVHRLPSRPILSLAAGWAHTLAVVAPSDAGHITTTGPGRRRRHNCGNWFLNQAPWFVLGDLEAMFTQFANALVQLMLLFFMLNSRCGMPYDMIAHRILPAAGLALMLGACTYSGLSFYVSFSERRVDVTAMPHGLNTVMMFAIIFLIMGPTFDSTGDPEAAFEAGLTSSVTIGLLTAVIAPFCRSIEKFVPRAAIVSCVAGVGLAFLAMGSLSYAFRSPFFSLPPVLILLTYATSDARPPLGLPSGLLALATGALLGAISRWLDLAYKFEPFGGDTELQLVGPSLQLLSIANGFRSQWILRHVGTIVPLALTNAITQLHNIEAAKSVGDAYSGRLAVLIDAGLTVLSALLGNPFPTTCFLGHTKAKAAGARIMYIVGSAVAAAVVCWCNGVPLLLKFIPMSAGLGVVLFVGVQVTAWAFNPAKAAMVSHGTAAAIGILPAIAAVNVQMVQSALQAAGPTALLDLHRVLDEMVTITAHGGMGMAALAHGFMTTSFLLSAAFVWVLEREFFAAAVWFIALSGCAFAGIVHSFDFENGVAVTARIGDLSPAAPEFGVVYLLAAAFCLWQHWREKDRIREQWYAKFVGWMCNRPSVSSSSAESQPLLSSESDPSAYA